MLTVVPTELAASLCDKKKVKDYNTLPQLNKAVIETVREFMTENVGYSELPMACLRINAKNESIEESDFFHYIPANSKENVLFQLEMPEDMIVSISYQTLLDASVEAEECGGDRDGLALVKEDLMEQLKVGELSESEEVISFIPFLEYTRCKFYARFDDNFEPIEIDLPGLEKLPLAKLSAFVD
jgi:hypothetical protein